MLMKPLVSGDVLLQAPGNYNYVVVQEARPLLEAVLRDNAGDVVLDLSRVEYLDETGVGSIAYLFKRLLLEGRALLLAGVTGQPMRILRRLQIDRAVRILDDEEFDGLRWLGRGAAASGPLEAAL